MEVKRCIACQQEIDSRALKCHWCKQIQTRIANLQNKSLSSYLALGVFLLVIAWIIYESTRAREITEYTDQLFARDFEVHLSENKSGELVSCFGIVKNRSDFEWGRISLSAEFYSDSGKVIDIHTKLYPDITLNPGKTIKLKVAGSMGSNSESYDKCEIKVVRAR